MNDCARFRILVPLLTGGDLNAADTARVAAHVAGCPRCRAEEDGFRKLQEMARSVARVDGQGMPNAMRRRIALEAAQRVSSASWLQRAALALMDAASRPALATAAAAVVVGLLIVPHAIHKSASPEGTETAIRIDVVAEGGEVRLAWVDGHKDGYTITKSPDPRTFSPREAYRVDGNVWIDRKPDSWQVVFYRIE